MSGLPISAVYYDAGHAVHHILVDEADNSFLVAVVKVVKLGRDGRIGVDVVRFHVSGEDAILPARITTEIAGPLEEVFTESFPTLRQFHDASERFNVVCHTLSLVSLHICGYTRIRTGKDSTQTTGVRTP